MADSLQSLYSAVDTLSAAAEAASLDLPMPEGLPVSNVLIGIASTIGVVALIGLKVYGEWVRVKAQQAAPQPEAKRPPSDPASGPERAVRDALGDYSVGLRATIEDLRTTVAELRAKLDGLRADLARTEGELAVARELNEQKDEALRTRGEEYDRMRRRVTAGFTLAVTVFAFSGLAAWLGGGDVVNDYRAYQSMLTEKERTIESLRAVLGPTTIELPDVEPIDVRFVKDGGHYVKPAEAGYVEEVKARWDEVSLRPGVRPVVFLVSYASNDGASSYNTWVSAQRASIVTAELCARGVFVGAMVAKELSGALPDVNDKVVRIRIALITDGPPERPRPVRAPQA